MGQRDFRPWRLARRRRPRACRDLFGDLTKPTRRVLQHELTHGFVSFYFPKASPWIHEGFAEYYETMALEDDHVVLGRPAFAFRRGLSWSGPAIPTAEARPAHVIVQFDRTAFSIDREKAGSPAAEREEQERVIVNRAGAWALVHLLKNGPEPYRERFQGMLKSLVDGMSSTGAWSKAFGSIDPDRLEADLAASIAPLSGEVIVLKTPYKPASSAYMQNSIARNLGLWGRVEEALPLSIRSIEGDPGSRSSGSRPAKGTRPRASRIHSSSRASGAGRDGVMHEQSIGNPA